MRTADNLSYRDLTEKILFLVYFHLGLSISSFSAIITRLSLICLHWRYAPLCLNTPSVRSSVWATPRRWPIYSSASGACWWSGEVSNGSLACGLVWESIRDAGGARSDTAQSQAKPIYTIDWLYCLIGDTLDGPCAVNPVITAEKLARAVDDDWSCHWPAKACTYVWHGTGSFHREVVPFPASAKQIEQHTRQLL
jgi:hypothetical protein